jgi:hypothetical protein
MRDYILRMPARFISAFLAAAALGGAAASAHAADAPKPTDFTVRPEPITSPVPFDGKTLKLDARHGKWGLTFNMQQPENRPATPNDVAAGAYYHITPSLRVGGAVAFGDEQLVQPGPQKFGPGQSQSQPRVKLESDIKF